MNRYHVNVIQVMCTDVEIEAGSEEEAKEKALHATARWSHRGKVFVDNFVTARAPSFHRLRLISTSFQQAIRYQYFANSRFLRNFENWRNRVRDPGVYPVCLQEVL
jgi:hypothetical protein